MLFNSFARRPRGKPKSDIGGRTITREMWGEPCLVAPAPLPAQLSSWKTYAAVVPYTGAPWRVIGYLKAAVPRVMTRVPLLRSSLNTPRRHRSLPYLTEDSTGVEASGGLHMRPNRGSRKPILEGSRGYGNVRVIPCGPFSECPRTYGSTSRSHVTLDLYVAKTLII